MSTTKQAPQQEVAPATPAQEQAAFDAEFERLAGKDSGENSQGEGEQADAGKAGATAAAAAGGAAETGAPAATEAAQQEAATQTAEDLWKDATPAQRAAFEQVSRRFEDAEHRARADAGRVSALHRKTQDLERRLQTQQPTQAQVSAAMKAPESWKKFSEDFPDIAKAVDDRFTTLEKGVSETVEQATQPLYKARAEDSQRAQQEQLRSETHRVDEAHPGWRNDVNSPEFKAWLSRQAPIIQAGFASDNADDAILVLDRFKSAAGHNPAADIQQRRAQRVAQAAGVNAASRPAQQGRAELPNDYDAAWDELDRRSRTGA